MSTVLTTVSLPQVYCRTCHLSTRSDVTRCLPASPAHDVTPGAAKAETNHTARPPLRKLSPSVAQPSGCRIETRLDASFQRQRIPHP